MENTSKSAREPLCISITEQLTGFARNDSNSGWQVRVAVRVIHCTSGRTTLFGRERNAINETPVAVASQPMVTGGGSMLSQQSLLPIHRHLPASQC